MLRMTAIAIVTVLVACSPPRSKTAEVDVSNTASSAPASYEAAPVVTPVDFNEPPDLRDKICSNQYGRGDNYDTVTKASGAFCR